MKKILETSLGRFSELTFDFNGRAIPSDKLSQTLIDGCNDYSIYSKGGVVVHMSREEFEAYQNLQQAQRTSS